MKKVFIYDSTLRDGAQAQGISFSVEDKFRIVERLDAIGIDYIEAGNPGSNPKDMEFFRKITSRGLKHSRLIAFGSTRRVGSRAEDDANLKSLLDTDLEDVAIFGKSWDFHVSEVLRTDNDENLAMIHDTISFLVRHKRRVVFDAELFFEGYRSNPEYAMATVRAAVDAGAACICLCETTGGSLPDEIRAVTAAVAERFPVQIGIHCHNDSGMAVANSLIAVSAGATQVQGTFNGFGERCGNANLSAIIPNLQLKMGCSCVPEGALELLMPTARFISEVANIAHDERAPYVGRFAFAHKAGMHSDAVSKNPATYEHVDPSAVGNERQFLMSEVAGRSAVLSVIRRIDPSITRESPETRLVLEKLKELEKDGYQYEGAESSFELVVMKLLGIFKPSFELKEFKVMVNEPSVNDANSSAMIKINVRGEDEITAAEGDGPVNALDRAMRKALERFYPEIERMKLMDYKVRVLDSESATAAKVRVLIESTDGADVWTTIGVSTDIIDASWKALVDSVEYMLRKRKD